MRIYIHTYSTNYLLRQASMYPFQATRLLQRAKVHYDGVQILAVTQYQTSGRF